MIVQENQLNTKLLTRMGVSLLLFAVFFVGALPSSAQGILPKSFAGWLGSPTPGLAAPVYHNGDKTVQLTEDAKAARQEYGFVSGENATYTRGSDSLTVNLYKMKDVSGAYGLYSYLRTTDMPQAGIREHSSASQDHALVMTGNLVLEVQGLNLLKETRDVKALTDAVEPHAEKGLLPMIQQHLPTHNFVDRTDKYVLGPETLSQVFPLQGGDWLGFSQGAEAETAKYRVNGHELNLVIADFPTPQTAAKRLSELRGQFDLNGSKGGTNPTPLFARRDMTLVAIVSGATSEKEANAVLDQIASGAEITWNEPTFQFKEPSITMMIVGAITGTGVICLFAVIAGLAFGGVRLVVKRATNRVFDRPDQVQVLQLGLSSKPINAEDFYGYRK
jgi:hypothetical protein